MSARVADASIVAAIAFAEPRAQEALVLTAGKALYAPTLLRYEVASAAWKNVQRGSLSLEEASYALDGALSLGIRWAEVDHRAVLELAVHTALTVYDAAYLYVARELGIPLVTFDERLKSVSLLYGLHRVD
jgi:predicted nucleic acid-binding protein